LILLQVVNRMVLTIQERSCINISMKKLDADTRARILQMLCEGVSIRAITRMTGVSRNTINKLLIDAGRIFSDYQDKAFRNLNCKRVQVDEVWSFIYAKAKNVPENKIGEAGDCWTWTSVCADSKLMFSWYIGSRDAECAKAFMQDVKGRLANRVQLTSDGHRAYLEAVESTFGNDIDYAQLVKLYGEIIEGQVRYSPAECVGIKKTKITGNPDPCCISTSFVERQNLNIRMHLRRFTRLTNAFSKKVENHAHAFALMAMYYNFVRIHKTLRVTPAMAAGVTDRLWEMQDLVAMIEATEVPQKRGPYKKRKAA